MLENLQWGDVSGSPFLTELKQAVRQTGKVSIKFNVDGMNVDFRGPDFAAKGGKAAAAANRLAVRAASEGAIR